jgi:hypothetical protein
MFPQHPFASKKSIVASTSFLPPSYTDIGFGLNQPPLGGPDGLGRRFGQKNFDQLISPGPFRHEGVESGDKTILL